MRTLKVLFSSKIFLAGLLIRLLFMPFTGHFDIRGINFAVYNLPFRGITNVYEVAAHDPVDYIVNVNFGREYFIYPPLNYFTLGAFMTALRPLYGGEFVEWIQGYGSDVNKVITHPHVFRYLFLMKVPYLFFDIAMLLLLRQFYVKDKEKNLAGTYWWLNPIVIFLPYMWGQFDIIPAFFVMWGVLRVIGGKPLLGAFLLGIGASFKNYPLLIMPVVAVVAGRTWKDMIKIMAAGIAPFLATTVPFAANEFFRDTVLFSWQSQKMLDFMWGIGGDEGVYPFVIGYCLIFLYSLINLRSRHTRIHIPIIAVFMWYFATTNFHSQWVMWIVPFLTLLAVTYKEMRTIGMWLIGLFFLRLSVIQADATVELFRWTAPVFEDLPKTRTIMGMIYDIHKLRNIVNSVIMGTALWLSYHLLNKEHHDK